MKNFDDETLMAFADGQLDEPLFSEVAAAVEAEPALAERLEMLILGKDLAKAVYAPLAEEAVPAHLTQAIAAAAGRDRGAPNVVPLRKPRPRFEWVGLAVAACLGVVVAGPAGYLLSQVQPQDGLRVGGALNGELAALVGTAPSGEELRLADGTALRPIATFEDASGTLCREFEMEDETATVAVACRPGSEWQVAFAVNTARATDGYTPAAGFETLEAYLQSIGATAPLPLDAEARALRQ